MTNIVFVMLDIVGACGIPSEAQAMLGITLHFEIFRSFNSHSTCLFYFVVYHIIHAVQDPSLYGDILYSIYTFCLPAYGILPTLHRGAIETP